MSPRDHYVAGEPPKFSRDANGFKHLDGSSADWRTTLPAADTRADRRARKRALRNYRKHVRPMADEPSSLLDSWPFLAVLGVVFLGVLLWQAGVFQ